MNPMIFSYASVEELSADKIVANAIELRVKHFRCQVSAQIDFKNAAAAACYNQRLCLKLNYTDASGQANYNLIPLGTAPVTLFSQVSEPGSDYYTYRYDAQLLPFTAMGCTGQSDFSITFTLSHP